MDNKYIIKGNILYSKDFGEYKTIKNGYIVVVNKLIEGTYDILPDKFNNLSIYDYGNSLIIPGFIDLHLHAPQYPNLGIGIDKELIPWLETYTFPEEAKYNDLSYAREVYKSLVKDLWKVGTTRSCIFSSLHLESTRLLMDLLDKAGLSAYVGKVNMDNNSPENLTEKTDTSIKETEELLLSYSNKYNLVKPIITPRFAPSCSLELLKKLGLLAKKHNIPVQSHLSENLDEIKLVKNLYPMYKNYSQVYECNGLFGDTPTIMAHCVLVNDEEIELIKSKNVFIAHCPTSNLNLSSGIAPVRRFIQRGISVGLGSDISAGHTLEMNRIISYASQVSNIKWLESGKVDDKLSIAELFYLATKGGGKFFGKVGSFEKGYEFDALVINNNNKYSENLSIEEMLQKFIYTGTSDDIKERFISGVKIEEPVF